MNRLITEKDYAEYFLAFRIETKIQARFIESSGPDAFPLKLSPGSEGSSFFLYAPLFFGRFFQNTP